MSSEVSSQVEMNTGNKPEVVDLFPIPLVIEPIPVDKEELEFAILYLSNQENLYMNSDKNYSSKDSYILNLMPKLNKQIENSLSLYIPNILGENSNLKITQSWLNFNPPGTSHHHHYHPNSIISGIVYLQNDDDTGNIEFHRPASQIRPILDDVKNWNKYNFHFVYFTPKVNNMFLFPSSLYHKVTDNKSTINRISLSFNTFYQGVIGSRNSLQELDLRGENGLLTHPKKGKVAKKR